MEIKKLQKCNCQIFIELPKVEQPKLVNKKIKNDCVFRLIDRKIGDTQWLYLFWYRLELSRSLSHLILILRTTYACDHLVEQSNKNHFIYLSEHSVIKDELQEITFRPQLPLLNRVYQTDVNSYREVYPQILGRNIKYSYIFIYSLFISENVYPRYQYSVHFRNFVISMTSPNKTFVNLKYAMQVPFCSCYVSRSSTQH